MKVLILVAMFLVSCRTSVQKIHINSNAVQAYYTDDGGCVILLLGRSIMVSEPCNEARRIIELKPTTGDADK